MGCLGLFIAQGAFLEATALQGPPASQGPKMNGSWNPWKYLDFLFLKRYGSWKSNGWIKSYGSRKFVVHRSVRRPGFCDISTVGMRVWIVRFWPRTSCWNESLIIFAMALVSTCSGQTRSKLLKIFEKLGFGVKLWKTLFSESLDLVWPLVKPRAD